MNKLQLGKTISHVSTIYGEFTLRSGQIATVYFDKYLFEADPVILSAVADHMLDILPVQLVRLAGLEMGGIPIATAMSLKSNLPLVLVRKEAKKYGTCNLIEGGEIEGKELIIIEDVVTSGGAILDAVFNLRLKGAIVNHVCCVIDRESSGRANIEAAQLTFTPLFTKSELESYSK